MTDESISWLKEVEKEDYHLVGNKAADLGELLKSDFPIPPGFIVTTHAYHEFFKENHINQKIQKIIFETKIDDAFLLEKAAQEIRTLILQTPLSDHVLSQIFSAYKKLGGILHDAFVAIRVSPTVTDKSSASSIGLQEIFLNVKGEANVLLKIKGIWASFFNSQALIYRHEKRIDYRKTGLAVIVQKMIESEKSGMIYTTDPATNDKTKIIIEAIYGLGDLLAHGTVTPDHYEVSKSTQTIISKTIAEQTIQLVKKQRENKGVRIPGNKAKTQKITDKEILSLSALAEKIERYCYFPQEIAWAIEKNQIFVLELRPVSHQKQEPKTKIQEHQQFSVSNHEVLLRGKPSSPGLISGPVKILHNPNDGKTSLSGEVFVLSKASLELVPFIKKAAAIVAEEDGETSDIAVLCREFGIPAVFGAFQATEILKNGNTVTVNGANGEIYKGGFLQATPAVHSTSHVEIATKIYANVQNSSDLTEYITKTVDGLGIFHSENLIRKIGYHPKEIVKEGLQKVFIEQLSEELENICKKVASPVLYKFSDFTTREYKQFPHGNEFEQDEVNPLLGYHGAKRFIYNPEMLELELDAIKFVRNKKNLKNLSVIIPFVRTVEEFIEMKKIISLNGLHRSPTFKIWIDMEIPANVAEFEAYVAAGLDGISIGFDILANLLLGIDIHSSIGIMERVETNETILSILKRLIRLSHTHKLPSLFWAKEISPTLLQYIVHLGVTGVVIGPNAIHEIRKTIETYEKHVVS